MAQQAPSFYRRRIGDAVVTTLSDGTLPFDLSLFGNITMDEILACLAKDCRSAPIMASLNTYLIESGGRLALVDAGGGGMVPTCGQMLGNLRAAGHRPEDVDTVLITHLHPDHVGGAIDGAGQAVFPNATLQVNAADVAFWVESDMREKVPEGARVFFDLARAACAAYGDRLRPFSAGELFPGVQARPLPGHTPGHTGYEIAGEGETLLIWGDVFHVPEVQSRHPEATVGPFDIDGAQAAATRAAVLKRAVAENLLVAGGHLHFPAFSHVVPRHGAYMLVPEPWRPGI